MISYITSMFRFLFGKNEDVNDEEKEEFLAEQLMILDLTHQNSYDNILETKQIPKTANCFQRTGVVTYLDSEHILIDGLLYLNLESCSLNVRLNDKVLYLGYRDENESIIVVRLLECYGTYWGEENNDLDVEENTYEVIEHVVIGEVEGREGRWVYMKDNDLKFDLDNIIAPIVPVKGDWLELKCNVQWDEQKPHDIAAAQVLKVLSCKPLRCKIKCGTITEWTGESGTCDRQIYFNKHCIQDGTEPKVGSKVCVEAIESNQGLCVWRAIKLITDQNNTINTIQKVDDADSMVEVGLNIAVTPVLKFDNVDMNESATINLSITNNSDGLYIINKWILLSSKRSSQVNISPVLSRPRKIYPKQSISFTITCFPKFLGSTKEQLIIMFQGFRIKRFIEINVVNKTISHCDTDNIVKTKSEHDKIESMKKIRCADNSFVPGVRVVKPCAFVPVRLGQFNIPQKIWSFVLGDSEQTVYTSEFKKILSRIETCLPCLSQNLVIGNYIDRWHTLLYMEEIQSNINMRAYDIPKEFLIRCQEYLSMEIKGLSEKRPSLIPGDRVIVKDVWNNDTSKYEGYIHEIKGDMVLMKFHRQFHESYSGSDVSVEFHFNRVSYRRAHQAINLALSNLGVDVLFPSRVLSRPPQIKKDLLEHLKWYNNHLNVEQKLAISSILQGECRPLPYCIYGPPGTGKTITVIEVILQILSLLPDSRILVATPSNSAANLITERLIHYNNVISGSVVRLLANYLIGSDNIPDIIKPFCATLDIAKENTNKSRHVVENGINLNCQTSFIGRHRVTIGTCYSIGTLAQLGLPRGHFTHVIVDEAGQATEPEIMIPMTFIDKENGQIILAGDPMQLGPVIMSRYSKEFGLGESYLSRILETFPYQKDFDAFKNGFNNKLVTKLTDNYRSLNEVLSLPSEMFYDASLMQKLDRTQSWITEMLDVVSEIFDTDDKSTGGIFVYGLRGCNTRANDSPSWYNPQEAAMLALTICKLYKKNIKPSDIGVIAPYIAQIKYIRKLFDAMGLPQAKIGTVEEFQGQERPIILMSTVRTSEAHLFEDQRNTLGFVRNPKRLNVAITRAQVACLIFCDPTLLIQDKLWQRVIKYAVDNDKYMGCDLPYKQEHDYNKNM